MGFGSDKCTHTPGRPPRLVGKGGAGGQRSFACISSRIATVIQVTDERSKEP